MTQDLFVDSQLEFEKVGAEVTLPEDPNAWPSEILQELFKQVPYIADFEPHVVMDRVDAERAYAFGHVEVMNKTEIQRGTDAQAMASAGIKQVRLPIVVHNRKLKPFDLLITETSKTLPLTESRLRQAVFRPQAFDVTSMTPGDTSMIGQLYPPYRQNYGFGGGGASMSVGMGKQGSERHASILAAILPTIEPQDYSVFFDRLGAPGLQAAFIKNAAATAPSLSTLGRYEPLDEMKLAAEVLEGVPASVVQVVKTAEGYDVKVTNHHFWAPVVHGYDRGQVCRAFGEKIAFDADTHGAVTLTEGAAVDADMPEADVPALVKDFGMYKVQDDQGRHLVGYVLPNLIDIDGQALPIALFTNGSQSALQGDIAGIAAGPGAALPEAEPSGHGCFYQTLPNGKTQATVPMTIHAHMDAGDGDGAALVGETFDGREVQVALQPNLTAPQAGASGKFLLPETMRWLPLDKSEEVVLTSDPETFQKTAHPIHALASVVVRSGGEDSYSIEGPALRKLAYEEKNFLTFNDAVFLLAGLGVTPTYATQKLAEAWGHSEPTPVRIGRGLQLAGEQVRGNETKFASVRALVHELRVDLLKEAAAIPDPVAVDTILSLGFLNPENLGTFVGYLPQIDESQARMCELLLATRLGLRDIAESALENAIRSTEEVLEGLRVLAFAKN